MAVEGRSHTLRDRPAPVGGRRPALARAMSLVLWLLAVSLLIGQAGLLAVHVPLGVAVVGLVGTLLDRTRNLTRPATHPTSS